MNGTAVCGEPVFIIEVEAGDVRLKTGRIVSDGSDSVQAKMHRITVAATGKKSRRSPDPLTDTAAKEFNVDDIHLLSTSEAQALKNPETAEQWFGSIYQDWVIRKIQRIVKKLKVS